VQRVLTIAGSDSGGGAGIQADLKTIAALGGFGMSVVTALTAQNTLGVQGVWEVPAEFVKKQFDSVASDIGIDAAKTGMLSSSEIIRAVAARIRRWRVRRLVVDPVMVAKGGSPLLRHDARDTLIGELIPLALVVTPNVPEAEVLAGMGIADRRDMEEAAVRIRRLGARNVVIKGGHLAGEAVDLLYDGRRFYEFSAPRIETPHTHGTGCTFAAALATLLARGKDLPAAVGEAKGYVTEAIRFALPLGKGHGPTGHLAPLLRRAERYDVITALRGALGILKRERVGALIPEIQSNFAYALTGAVSPDEVAAFPGRIVRVGEDIEAVHDPDFGASRHVARVVLTAMRFDDRYRSAMNIRYGQDVLDALAAARLDAVGFDRAEEPPDVKAREGSSLEWGTKDALSRCGSVPDAVFDGGDVGKEPIVRILGRDPWEVAKKVVRLSRLLKRP